ncbi:MAG: LysE family transporter [Deltaproteobacteria bacterium]|nr:LysE family transporter [Deltaproteobacteria bacterium]
MTNVDWIGFTVASLAVVLAPGPGSVFVAKTAGSVGARAGRMAMFGIMLGDTCLIMLSLLGISALFMTHPSLFHAVRLIGAGYLIFLGLQSIFANRKNKSVVPQDSALSLRRALTITLLNPKAVFFFMAFFPVFIQSAQGGLLVPYVGMTFVFMAISFTYLCILSHVSSRVGVAFQESHTIQSITRKVCGWLFIGFGIKVAVASR